MNFPGIASPLQSAGAPTACGFRKILMNQGRSQFNNSRQRVEHMRNNRSFLAVALALGLLAALPSLSRADLITTDTVNFNTVNFNDPNLTSPYATLVISANATTGQVTFTVTASSNAQG